jgi:signal transduction histidine kinase
MVSLLGYLEYLRLDHGDALGPEGNHDLDRMADSTLYMQQLVHDLIDLSRIGRAGSGRSRSTWAGWSGRSPRTPARPTPGPSCGSGACRW